VDWPHLVYPVPPAVAGISQATTKQKQAEQGNQGSTPMSTTTQAPRQLDPSASLHPETLGLAPGRGRLAGRRIIVVGAGQRKIVDEDPPIGNGRAMSVLFAREGAHVACIDIDKDAADTTVAQIA